MNPHAPVPPRRQTDVFLRPGEYFVGDASYRVRTVLGSCVSVTLWCPPRCIGAMSHFLLASRGEAPAQRGKSGPVGTAGLSGHYGDEALALMLQELARLKVQPQHCQAKIFGGGDMFPGYKSRSKALLAVGQRNGEAARSLLQARGIEVVSESLFGAGHRQVAFDMATGHVWSRQIKPWPEEKEIPA